MSHQQGKSWLQRYKVLVAGMSFVLVLVLILGLYSSDKYAVIFDGEIIAYTQDKQDVHNVIDGLLEEKSEQLGQPVDVDNKPQCKIAKNEQPVTSSEELREILKEKLTFVTGGKAVKIDGEIVFQFKDGDTANDFIDQLKGKYKRGDNCRVSFKEEVNIVSREVKLGDLLTVDEALQEVEEGKAEEQIHIVKENDTLWELARDNDITVEKLKELNPQKSNILQPGEEVVVSRTKPLVTVRSEYSLTEEKKIPFETRYKYDSSLGMGKRETVQEGEEGLKKVTYDVVSENGKVIEKESLDEKVIEKPEPRVINKGTKLMLSSRESGLVWPVSGRLTSTFGRRWGEQHQGIDIGAGYGSPVRASAGGVVSRVQTLGGYGKLIEIDHGNGIQTIYAHLSSFNVSSGQRVDRGELIGKVGTTGHVTGPHLHFEVRINGQPKDPLKYL